MEYEIPARLLEAFADIVEGKIVKRSRHSLLWKGCDCSTEFSAVLREKGFVPALVKDVEVQPGERVPAFYLCKGEALFGWVFWEKFTDRRLRKLFGSVVRNEKGDWEVQISEKKTIEIFVNHSLRRTMDIDRPSGI